VTLAFDWQPYRRQRSAEGDRWTRPSCGHGGSIARGSTAGWPGGRPLACSSALEAFTAPPSPRYALVSNLDGILLLRCDIRGLLAPADATRSAAGEKGPMALASLVYLPNHAILDRGRLIGLWEYDPGLGEIAWTCFIRPDAALRQQVRATEQFIRDDLSDMRAFSLDSPKSRQPRLDQLRAAQAH
jgi:hypothetical protein